MLWRDGSRLSTALVVAHPDDEVIGGGALLTRLPQAVVLHVTDGAPRNERDMRAAGFAGWRDYAAARRRETEAALALAGLGAERLRCLGIPDQQATLDLAALARQVAAFLRDRSCAAVLTHAYEGGHPDHDATAFAVHAACRLLARDGGAVPELTEMAGYHAQDGGVATGVFLPHPGAGPVEVVELDAAMQNLKRRMLDCHATQGTVLAPFSAAAERFRRAPRYDFALPPHPGTLHYERYDWGMTGERWRRLAQAALDELRLSSPL